MNLPSILPEIGARQRFNRACASLWSGRRAHYADLFAIGCCLFFLMTGLPHLSALGIETDEALFSAGIYEPFGRANSVTVFHHRISLMVMTYVGAVKSWLYWPILALFPPSAWSVRVPMLVLGAITVWLFYRLLVRSCGTRAAVVGCALLATDPMFLLMTRYDWGPVAIQHFCLVAALLSILRFHQEKRRVWLAAGFFLLGLGIWDKAIFGWCLMGAGAAALLVFPRAVLSNLRPRTLGIACGFLVLGALPLIVFNIRQRGVTFRTNIGWSTAQIGDKARLLRETARGAALYGVLARERADGPPRDPSTPLDELSSWLPTGGGNHRTTLGWYLLVAGVVVLPFLRRGAEAQAARFAALSAAVMWLLMAVARGGGTGAHHVILLWPLPAMLVAAALAACSRLRPPGAGMALLAAIASVAALSNLLVTRTYYQQEVRYGARPAWTEAFYGMAAAVQSASVKQVRLLDWGFFDGLRLMRESGIGLGPVEAPVSTEQRKKALAQIADGKSVFVAHTAECGTFADDQAPYLSFARKSGYERAAVQVFRERSGRPCIEMFRFVPAPGAARSDFRADP